MAIYAGIDGGGTKTTCAVGDESRVLGTAVAGGSNVVRSGEAQARESLQAALKGACAAAGVSLAEIQRVCVGASGAGRPEQKEVVRRALAEMTPGDIMVVGDMDTTMYAAFKDGPGVIVIAGTGSIAYGRDATGKTARAGGWGFAVSDEGSGQWIGRTAVSAALRARDEGRESQLLDRIREEWGLTEMDELVRVANASPAPNFAQLFPVVLGAASTGDDVALHVLHQAGDELARIAGLVMRKLFTAEERIPLAMSGGVFREAGVTRDAFCGRVLALWPRVELREGVVEPVEGALAMARKGHSPRGTRGELTTSDSS